MAWPYLVLRKLIGHCSCWESLYWSDYVGVRKVSVGWTLSMLENLSFDQTLLMLGKLPFMKHCSCWESIYCLDAVHVGKLSVGWTLSVLGKLPFIKHCSCWESVRW